MSIPIKYCFLVEAIDDPTSFKKLHTIMYGNLLRGHFTVFPCNHDPPCRQLTDQEQSDLLARFRKEPTR